MIKVAFQGTQGAYSEMALHKFFKSEKNVQAIGFDHSEDVCLALENNEVKYGIFPVENSIVGNVDVNLDLLFKYPFYSFGEIYFPIKHKLLALPGVSLEEIVEVHSHPVALEQCHDFLKENNLKAIPDYDTAGASKSLIARKIHHQATISSQLCANYYGLEIIQDDIQKVQNNYTRFLIFSSEDKIPKIETPNKTSIAFITKHKPGSLLRCLKTFADHKINMTKIESRPIPENPFAYIFFMDIQGGIHFSAMKECLFTLRKETQSIKILGSYPEAQSPFNEP